MLRTLRNRLILSHALPLLIIVPIMGILLIYVLETQYLIPGLTRNLEGDARLIADLVGAHPEFWENPRLVQDLLDRLEPDQAERILLLSPQGYLLASTDPTDAERLDQVIEIPNLPEVLRGQVVSSLSHSQRLRGEVIDVVAPVFGADTQVVGIVRLTYRYDTFYEEFSRLRYLIGGILLFGLLIGVSLGSILALNIGNPIRRVTQAVYDLASGKRSEPIPEKGPEEVRQLQRAANHLLERLHTLEESRRKLLANLVHELGRPMGALRAAIQALLRGAKADPQLLDELLLGMDEETMRLQRLTEDLAELYEQVLGTLELDYQQICLAEWLARVLRPWQEEAHEAWLHWEVDIPASLPAIRADPDRLAQAIGNLVSNAIKYTPAGGKVSVSAGSEDAGVWVRVGDTGPGIAPEERERIFTPFYRGAHGKRFPQGMGLGLSITRDLIAAHGGRIEIESTPGFGSEFTIWLPQTRFIIGLEKT
ncbi:MAG TPA: sensor histidine kinase [Anaerolineales bacterium]